MLQPIRMSRSFYIHNMLHWVLSVEVWRVLVHCNRQIFEIYFYCDNHGYFSGYWLHLTEHKLGCKRTLIIVQQSLSKIDSWKASGCRWNCTESYLQILACAAWINTPSLIWNLPACLLTSSSLATIHARTSPGATTTLSFLRTPTVSPIATTAALTIDASTIRSRSFALFFSRSTSRTSAIYIIIDNSAISVFSSSNLRNFQQHPHPNCYHYSFVPVYRHRLGLSRATK